MLYSPSLLLTSLKQVPNQKHDLIVFGSPSKSKTNFCHGLKKLLSNNFHKNLLRGIGETSFSNLSGLFLTASEPGKSTWDSFLPWGEDSNLNKAGREMSMEQSEIATISIPPAPMVKGELSLLIRATYGSVAFQIFLKQ